MPAAQLLEKRRILQLETLYDLALALQAHRPEGELVEELLQRVCAVMDPRAAVAATRSDDGALRAVSSVGWPAAEPAAAQLAEAPLWADVDRRDGVVERAGGTLAGRDFRQLLATRIAYRGETLGLLAVLDKESRAAGEPSFSDEESRFLESVAALAGVALENARQMEQLSQEREVLEEENRALKGELVSEVEGRRIVAHAPIMRAVLERAERVAPRSVNVLVRGESGTGKELIARLLHVRSGRTGPLIALNCAALPETLLESELFGIEGGVATGVTARRGKFELADEGTLFLDEVGDLALPLQVKLLRTLQEREITRVGGREPIPVDTRVVAATHRSLEQLVRDGRFREDLYYRLRGVDIELPPLRERREDIAHLVRHFAREFSAREGLPEPRFDREALALLLAWDYPGNVRELQTVVEGAISLAPGRGDVGGRIDASLIRSLLGAGSAAADGAGTMALGQVEERHIARVMRLVGGNKSAAAKLLGVNRRTLHRKGF
ncbi:MAG TPA: sigma 54-interacting transcriptional regulator [Thermoanaerobaculia bacterium]|nr:sigma 54-interacting transcriptional regulator [Thermoanaerobaculia bacterium]